MSVQPKASSDIIHALDIDKSQLSFKDLLKKQVLINSSKDPAKKSSVKFTSAVNNLDTKYSGINSC